MKMGMGDIWVWRPSSHGSRTKRYGRQTMVQMRLVVDCLVGSSSHATSTLDKWRLEARRSSVVEVGVECRRVSSHSHDAENSSDRVDQVTGA